MSCKSAIYAVDTTVGTAIADGGIYSPTTISRRYGQAIQLGANGINIQAPGYYDVDATVTVAAGAAGVIKATLFMDGVPVPGATSSLSAAANATITLPITTMVRVFNNSAQLTIVVSGAATTSNNLAIKVEKG